MMKMKFLYATLPGRLLLKWLMRPYILGAASNFLHSPVSRVFIKPYIKKNKIDMSDFKGQEYGCFADFFARKRTWIRYGSNVESLISPCDGRLSIFHIKNVREVPRFFVKGYLYSIHDLITQQSVADIFMEGYCFIYRLEAADYHHFCYIDDCYHGEAHKIKGTLHSVQPAALEKKPVFCMNRRVWSLMETQHFGTVAQIEVGAVVVGGIVHERENCHVQRGEEMGHFELAGSTIIQMFTPNTAEALELEPVFQKALRHGEEVRVQQGQVIGRLKNKKNGD